MIESPSSRVPEKAPRWDLTRAEACGGGNCFSLAPWMFSGYVGIYRRKKYVGGAPRGPRDRRARPHPRGLLAAPPTYFFRLYILLYPETFRESHETTFPLPQPSIPVRSHLGAFSGAPPEGESITEGFYINTIASLMMCE